MAYAQLMPFKMPAGLTPDNIIGIANNNHCYYWYSNGTVSAGTYNNTAAFFTPVNFTMPANESVSNILSMAIAKIESSYVYTWYEDGSVTVGFSTNLVAVKQNTPFYLPSGEPISNIVGIGIAGSNDHTYVWYNNYAAPNSTTYVSSGYSNDFSIYFSPVPSQF